jgi:hypothetical protein
MLGRYPGRSKYLLRKAYWVPKDVQGQGLGLRKGDEEVGMISGCGVAARWR